VRYASVEEPRSLFVSADVDTLRALQPGNPRIQRLQEGDRLIVSEPFNDLPGAWHEIPAGSALTVLPGGALDHQPFRPAADAVAPV
jgi:hypothetical protein